MAIRLEVSTKERTTIRSIVGVPFANSPDEEDVEALDRDFSDAVANKRCQDTDVLRGREASDDDDERS